MEAKDLEEDTWGDDTFEVDASVGPAASGARGSGWRDRFSDVQREAAKSPKRGGRSINQVRERAASMSASIQPVAEPTVAKDELSRLSVVSLEAMRLMQARVVDLEKELIEQQRQWDTELAEQQRQWGVELGQVSASNNSLKAELARQEEACREALAAVQVLEEGKRQAEQQLEEAAEGGLSEAARLERQLAAVGMELQVCQQQLEAAVDAVSEVEVLRKAELQHMAVKQAELQQVVDQSAARETALEEAALSAARWQVTASSSAPNGEKQPARDPEASTEEIAQLVAAVRRRDRMLEVKSAEMARVIQEAAGRERALQCELDESTAESSAKEVGLVHDTLNLKASCIHGSIGDSLTLQALCIHD